MNKRNYFQNLPLAVSFQFEVYLFTAIPTALGL